MRLPSMALAPLLALAACTSGPPRFRIEPGAVVVPQPRAEWLVVGSPSTPPPGDYRFARLHADGTGDVRELFTSSGPGRWLSFTGRVRIDASIVRAALTAAVRPETMPDDRRAPCVMAVQSGAGQWEGCAYPEMAARLLALVPRLTMPEVAPTCTLPICQVRILREVAPVRHEQYGDVRQDLLFDGTGGFWCAAKEDRPAGQVATLRVERGRIAETDAPRVYQVDPRRTSTKLLVSPTGSPPTRTPDAVMVRGPDASWARLPEPEARRVRARWNRMASRLPRACRPDR